MKKPRIKIKIKRILSQIAKKKKPKKEESRNGNGNISPGLNGSSLIHNLMKQEC